MGSRCSNDSGQRTGYHSSQHDSAIPAIRIDRRKAGSAGHLRKHGYSLRSDPAGLKLNTILHLLVYIDERGAHINSHGPDEKGFVYENEFIGLGQCNTPTRLVEAHSSTGIAVCFRPTRSDAAVVNATRRGGGAIHLLDQ